MTRPVRALRPVLSPEPDFPERANLWRRRHAVRKTTGEYPVSELGKLAVNGTTLDLRDGEVALSRSWQEPDCPACWGPEYFHQVPSAIRTRCRVHPERHLLLPRNLSFPWSDEEHFLAELREWPAIATRERIPARYRFAAFESSYETPGLSAALDFAEGGDGRGDAQAVTFAGPTSRGKTWDATCAFRRLALWSVDQASARYFHVPRLIDALVHPTTADDESVLDQCVEAELLFLDDLGHGFVKDGGLAEQQLEQIIVEREAEDLTTIITTNLTRALAAERLGDRVADRLTGPWGWWIDVGGPNLRTGR